MQQGFLILTPGAKKQHVFPVEFIDAQTHCRHDRFGSAALGWKRQGVMDRWDRGGVQHVRNIFLNVKKPHSQRKKFGGWIHQ